MNRSVLAQESVGADDLGLLETRVVAMVEHQHMIAEAIERVAVTARDKCAHIGDRRHLLVKDTIAQPLGALHLLGRAGEADLQIAEPAQGAGTLVEAPPISPHALGKALRHEG
jgi:hypothetical protein